MSLWRSPFFLAVSVPQLYLTLMGLFCVEARPNVQSTKSTARSFRIFAEPTGIFNNKPKPTTNPNPRVVFDRTSVFAIRKRSKS
jgi:hypothetical protein